MVARIPKSTDWECEYTDMGDCLRDYSAACWSSSRGRAGLGKGTTAGKAEDGDGCKRWEGRREERALVLGMDCIVYDFRRHLEDIPMVRLWKTEDCFSQILTQ